MHYAGGRSEQIAEMPTAAILDALSRLGEFEYTGGLCSNAVRDRLEIELIAREIEGRS